MALTKVSSSLVSDNAITTGKLVDGGVHSADIATNAITSTKIAQNSILTKHIDDGQVTTAQLGADAVTAAKIADDAISEEHLDVTVITGLTQVTAATGDLLMVADISDSNNLKKIPVSSILAGTLTNAAQTNITSLGTLTSLNVDTISMNGSSIAASGNLTLDVTGAITLDAGTGGTGIVFADDGTSFGSLKGLPAAPTRLIVDSAATAGYLSVAGTEYFAWNTTDIRPAQSNMNLGVSGASWNDLFITGSIKTTSGDLTLDVAGDINLDADGGDIQLKDGGVATGRLGLENGDLNIASMRQDYNILFKGMDGNTTPFTALTLDMSEAGAATFNSTIATGSGGASGKIAIAGNTATSEATHITFTNVQGAKAFAIGGGQSGVTNNGFVIRNVTDNTFPLVISDAGAATFSSSVTATGNYTAGNDASIFTFQRAGGAVSGNIEYNDATTDMEIGTTTGHSFSIKTGNTRRLSIDNSTGGIGIPGKLAVLAAAAHGSFDFYNNGTSYFNGQVTVDDHLTITGTNAELTVASNITMTAAADRRIFMGGQAGATFGLAYDSSNPNYGIFYTEASPDVVNISPNGSATDGSLRVLGNGQIEATGGNLYLTGNIDRRIKLSDSGNAGLSDSDNTVHIRANDDDLILNAAGNGTIRFKENGTEHLSIDKDGYAKFNSTRSEYGAEFKSAGTRSGFVVKKPGTDTIMGSVLMLSNEDFRLGTASHYHIRMAQNGDTYMGNTENAHFTETGALRITTSAGYNQLRLESNATDNTNKTSGITSLMYTNNTCSIFQGFFQNGSNAVYWGSADGAHRGLQRHYFYVNDNYNATSNHKLVMTLASSSTTALVVNGNNSTGGTVNWNPDSNKGSTESHCHYGSNGDWYIRPANVASGDVNVRNYVAESDERLKTNIVDITYGTTELLQLRPRKFEWKEGVGERNGFIAQEVESVIPAFVKTGEMKIDGYEEEDGIKTIDYNSIVATLVKTVQELEARIKTLEG